jgi:hypothetical protein
MRVSRECALFTTFAALLLTGAVRADPDAPPAPLPDKAAANENQVVCRLAPPVTGTRFSGGRECRTILEWKQREQDAQTTVRHIQRIGLACAAPPCSSGGR